MDNSFQTSFIPKKPVDDVIKRDHKLDLFTVISILILILVVLASAGLYVYKIYLTKQKEAIIVSLEKSQGSFEQETIMKLESFDKKTSAVKEILSKHKVLTPLFSILSEITIPNVQYTKFSHEGNMDKMVVKIEGLAKDYASIAQQSEIYNSSKGRFFSDVVFSDLTKSETGNTINFKLEFSIDPSLLSYEKQLSGNTENITQN